MNDRGGPACQGIDYDKKTDFPNPHLIHRTVAQPGHVSGRSLELTGRRQEPSQVREAVEPENLQARWWPDPRR